MPELPEVETVVRGLQNHIQGKTIQSVTLNRPNLRIPFPEDLTETLKDNQINAIHRKAKYILLTLNDDITLIIHLGMSGKIIYHETPAHLAPKQKHDHVLIDFTDNSSCIYHDPRRFGFITTANTSTLDQHPFFCHLGPDPFSNECNEATLFETLKKKHTSIKSALMDQRIIAGLGNIYVCESLFRSKISPTRKASSLTLKEVQTLLPHIQDILKEAIASGGSTLRDFVRSSGDSGYFQHQFQIYGREQEPCIHCQTPIERIVQQNRSTFFCPSCQI